MLEIKDAHGKVVHRFPALSGRNFDGADLRNINLKGGILEGAEFSNANLEDACLEGCDLYWARFFQAALRRANLRFSILRGCNFVDADLTDADLTGADLGIDNVGGETHLEGAKLLNCRIDGTIFTGASYDARTVFPSGFDPHRSGLIGG
jgi:uncharacterized protein YjbI with pentapeptide repeats